MEQRVVLVNAERNPMPGVAAPGPHQLYRRPRVSTVLRKMSALRPSDIRIKLIYGGICGTDLHLLEAKPATGYIESSAPMLIPDEGRVIGHEGVARILEVGSDVHHLITGDIVTLESIIICHHCHACRRGNFNQCQNACLMGLERDGIFGDVVDVPAMLAHEVNEMGRNESGLRAAACMEPAGVAYTACQNARVAGGDRVVIFGGGPIGVASAMLCRYMFGASRIHLVEPIRFRREHAARWCDTVSDVEQFFSASSQSHDVLIEASGEHSNVARAFSRIAANGRIVLLGRSGRPLEIEQVDHMITNQIMVVGSRGHLCGAFARVLALCASGRIPLHEIVTGTIKGHDELCHILTTPAEVYQHNCKVLVCFSERVQRGDVA